MAGLCVQRLSLHIVHAMLIANPDRKTLPFFTGDLGAEVKEKKPHTDLCSDWWPRKQGLVRRGSNRQSPLHQSSSNAAPILVPTEENQIISPNKIMTR